MDYTFLARVLQTGTVGVDIFLFLSGVGLYYSYTKNRLPYFSFEKKRLLRILPMYCLIGGLTYLFYDILIQHFSAWRFLSDFFFLSWPLRGSTRYWYILIIIVFYLLFPLFYRMIHEQNIHLLSLLLFCLLWWFAGETLCLKIASAATFRLAVSRLPIFLFGIYCGRLVYQNTIIPKTILITILFSGYISLVVLKRMIPYPFSTYLNYPVRALLAFSIIATVILVMEFLKEKQPGLHRVTATVLTWFGGLTLELYLFHQSYMILFDYPYRLGAYVAVAFLLPAVSAAIIYIGRKLRGKAKII